jgi:hypothetical protein
MPAATAAWRPGSARAGGEHLAQDHLVHLLRADLGALHRRLDGDRAERVGRERAKAPLKAPTGVRAAEAMTISVMDGLLLPICSSGRRLGARRAPPQAGPPFDPAQKRSRGRQGNPGR